MAAVKKAKTKVNGLEIPDDLSIPEFLKRSKDEKPTSADDAPASNVVVGTFTANKPRFDKPMSMTDEEFEETKKRFGVDQPKEPKEPKAPKKERVKRAEAPANTFALKDWARSQNLDPRHVRRVARAIKGELSKLYVNGLKYVFNDSDKTTVAKLIHDGFANETKKTITVKKPKKTPAIPPAGPDGAIWSGKAKKAKATPAPKSVDPKGDARKAAKKATREFKGAVKDAKGNKTKAAKTLKKQAVKQAKQDAKAAQ